MSKEELKPVDLGHLEDRAIAMLEALRASEDEDRSQEYRSFKLQKAKDLAEVQVRDFRHLFDSYNIGGITPYGLQPPRQH